MSFKLKGLRLHRIRTFVGELVSLKHPENSCVELAAEFGFQVRFFQYQTDKRNATLAANVQLNPSPTWESVVSWRDPLDHPFPTTTTPPFPKLI